MYFLLIKILKEINVLFPVNYLLVGKIIFYFCEFQFEVCNLTASYSPLRMVLGN